MPPQQRFTDPVLEALARAKILGVHAGSTHRYTGVWVVDDEGRVFVRSWNDKPSGWYRAFRAEPRGSIQLAGEEIAVVVRCSLSRVLVASSGLRLSSVGTIVTRRWRTKPARCSCVPKSVLPPASTPLFVARPAWSRFRRVVTMR